MRQKALRQGASGDPAAGGEVPGAAAYVPFLANEAASVGAELAGRAVAAERYAELLSPLDHAIVRSATPRPQRLARRRPGHPQLACVALRRLVRRVLAGEHKAVAVAVARAGRRRRHSALAERITEPLD